MFSAERDAVLKELKDAMEKIFKDMQSEVRAMLQVSINTDMFIFVSSIKRCDVYWLKLDKRASTTCYVPKGTLKGVLSRS